MCVITTIILCLMSQLAFHIFCIFFFNLFLSFDRPPFIIMYIYVCICRCMYVCGEACVLITICKDVFSVNM